MPIDPSVSLNAKPVDGMSQLKDLLGVASGAQKYQSDQLALTKARALLNPEIEQGKAASREAVANANVAEGTQGAKISQENTAAQSATLGLQQKEWQITNDALNAIEQDPAVKEGKDPNAIKKVISDQTLSAIQQGVSPQHAMEVAHQYMTAAEQNPSGFRNFVANHRQAAIGAAGQTAQTEVPVGQRQEIGTDLLGNQVVQSKDRFGQVQAPQAVPGGAPAKPVTALPAGGARAIAATTDTAMKDYQDTTEAASKAPQDIAVLKNLKRFAAGASTGVGADRRALINGVLGLVGVQGSEDDKTNYDLLVKNANILAGQGGNTDAARALAEVSNPNAHMTPEAINEAVDQIVAQRQMTLNKQTYLSPFKNNPEAYADHLRLWNKYADPRVVQYMNADDAGKAKLLKGMSPKDLEKFKAAGKFMESLGGGQ